MAAQRQRITETEDVPDDLRRLWRLQSGSRLGRPAELDVSRVLHAALRLADREGLAGVTLPRVAKALGYTTMSLYRHVGSKEELLSLISDAAVGPAPAIAVPPRRWRAGLREWTLAMRRVYERRPWLARLPISGPPVGPNQIAWMEEALRLLRETGLGWAEKVGVLTLLAGYVRQTSLLVQDLQPVRAARREPLEQRYARTLAALIDPERFPETAELLASGVFEAGAQATADPASDPDFVFGLERILDGVAGAVKPRRTAKAGH